MLEVATRAMIGGQRSMLGAALVRSNAASVSSVLSLLTKIF